MKWFMHQAQAHRDMKLKKVLMRYGAEGYGLYWYCIEQVCTDLEPRLTFELEHDSEILAHELKIDTLKVEEMMLYMVQLGLFEQSDSVVTCFKLAAHLGDNLTRNDKLKNIIKKSKSQTVLDSMGLSQQEERRREEKRREEKRVITTTPASGRLVEQEIDFFDLFWESYPKKTDKEAARKAWNKIKPTLEFTQTLITDCKNRVAQGEWCTGKNKGFIPGAAPYLNGKKYNNEIIPRADFHQETDFSQIARETEFIL
jgi:hypothetical protein